MAATFAHPLSRAQHLFVRVQFLPSAVCSGRQSVGFGELKNGASVVWRSFGETENGDDWKAFCCVADEGAKPLPPIAQ